MESVPEIPTEGLTLVERPEIDALAITRAPDLVLAEARKAAVALNDVIEKKKKKLQFNGQTYLQFEDWQTLGRFYGVTAMVVSSKYVEYGDVRGFEAVAEALLVANNQRISSAEAMCLNDEPKWGKRPKYEYIDTLDGNGKKIWDAQKGRYKSTRKQTGEEQVPLFQLKSMAQTRACAKALRNVLAWVVVLAGYAPTPAEEMDGQADSTNAEYDEATPLSNFQRRAWESSDYGKTEDQKSAYLKTKFGQDDPGKLKKEDFDVAMKWLVSNEPLAETVQTTIDAKAQGFYKPPVEAAKKPVEATPKPPPTRTLITDPEAPEKPEPEKVIVRINEIGWKPHRAPRKGSYGILEVFDELHPSNYDLFSWDNDINTLLAKEGVKGRRCIFGIDRKPKGISLVKVLEIDGIEYRNNQPVLS